MITQPKPIYYIPIHGTWAIDEAEIAWWRISGAFAQFSKRNNVHQFVLNGLPFIWSSDISGFKYNLSSGNAKHTDWRAAGWSLIYYLQNVNQSNRNLIIHSHGLQPVLYAASYGLEINNIISVCSPIRSDMNEVTEAARFRIKNWLHIYDSKDIIGWLGQFGDGKLIGSRKSAHSDENHHLSGINHTDILKIGKKMDFWIKNGWYDFLRK